MTVIEDRYDPQEFYSAVAGLENEPERGSRCTVCYRLRMRRAAQYAAEHGFQWFTTTLSISPHKDAKRINAIGQELEAEFGVKAPALGLQKNNGYLRSLQLSEEYGLYRQDYCGCEFSATRGIQKVLLRQKDVKKKKSQAKPALGLSLCCSMMFLDFLPQGSFLP